MSLYAPGPCLTAFICSAMVASLIRSCVRTQVEFLFAQTRKLRLSIHEFPVPSEIVLVTRANRPQSQPFINGIVLAHLTVEMP